MLSGLLAAPFIGLCFFTNDNFYLSISMLAANYLIAESWMSPAITMLQDSSKGKIQGFTINVYFMFATLAGSLSTFFLDFFNQRLNTDSDPGAFGDLLGYFVLVSYLGSVPFFYLAGLFYQKQLKERAGSLKQMIR